MKNISIRLEIFISVIEVVLGCNFERYTNLSCCNGICPTFLSNLAHFSLGSKLGSQQICRLPGKVSFIGPIFYLSSCASHPSIHGKALPIPASTIFFLLTLYSRIDIGLFKSQDWGSEEESLHDCKHLISHRFKYIQYEMFFAFKPLKYWISLRRLYARRGPPS